MGGDGTRWVDLARAEAWRRHHDAAEPEHLLAAMLDDDEIKRTLLGRSVDPMELREHLESRLAARQPVGEDCDATDVPCSSALERAIERMRRRSWWRLLGAEMSLLDSLLLERPIAELVLGLRRGGDHRHVLERARALAIVSGHETIGVKHVLRVLLDIESFVETVQRAGGSAEAMRKAADAALASQPVSELASLPKFDAVLRQALACGPQGAYEGTLALSIRELCLELARQPEAEPFWSAAGMRAADFTRAVHLPDEDRRDPT